MRRKSSRGAAILEFALVVTVFFVPLMLGTIGIGFNEVRALEVVQLARDAASLYARPVVSCTTPDCGAIDFSQTAGKTILSKIAGDLKLRITSGVLGQAGAGGSVVILSSIRRMDQNACQRALPDAAVVDGRVAGCSNQDQWVFSQRIIIGDSALREKSNYGAPLLNSAGLRPDTIYGDFTEIHQATNTQLVAQFSGINPVADGMGGLPAGKVIYIAEAAAKSLHIPGITDEMTVYSFSVF